MTAGSERFSVTISMALRRRLRTVEGGLALTLAWSAVRLLPFAWLARAAGTVETPDAEPCPPRSSSNTRAVGVGRAVTAASRRLPWHSTCLMQAVAGRLMLMRRGIPSMLTIGVASHEGRLGAHAWLLAYDEVICGGQEAPAFVPIVRFRANGPR